MGTLTLVNLDEHTGLAVGVGGEDLRLLGVDGGVSLDKGSHDTTGSLDTEGERSDVEQEKVLDFLRGVPGEDRSLDGSTVSDSLIRIDALVELLSIKEVGDEFDDPWDAGGTTD